MATLLNKIKYKAASIYAHSKLKKFPYKALCESLHYAEVELEQRKKNLGLRFNPSLKDQDDKGLQFTIECLKNEIQKRKNSK